MSARFTPDERSGGRKAQGTARDTGKAARGTGRRMERSRADGSGTGGAAPPDGGNLRKIVRKVMPIPRDRLWYIGKNYDFCQTNHTENPKHHARHRSDIRQGKLREGTPEAGMPPGRAGTPRHALRTGEGTHTQAPPVPPAATRPDSCSPIRNAPPCSRTTRNGPNSSCTTAKANGPSRSSTSPRNRNACSGTWWKRSITGPWS